MHLKFTSDNSWFSFYNVCILCHPLLILGITEGREGEREGGARYREGREGMVTMQDYTCYANSSVVYQLTVMRGRQDE